MIATVATAIGVATYVLAVWTTTGQTIENAALRGADQVSDGDFAEANAALGQITLASLAVATLLVAAIAVLRRQWYLGIAAVAIIGAGQVITQVLKRFVLPRPELVETTAAYTGNSLPSGHITIAMTLLFALMIVVPYRFRGVVVLFATPWAVSIGAYTITAKWHRFSDTLAADCVALAVACVVCLVAVRTGRLHVAEPEKRNPVGRGLLAGLLSLAFIAFGALGAFLWTATWMLQPAADIAEDNAYLGAHALATAGSVGAALAFWWTLHRVSLSGIT